jgi:anti-sigma factor RsiW
MDNQENIHWTDDPELLERYALGHIEDAQRRLLDDHLAVCDACRTAIRREKDLADGIRLAGRQRLRERLRDRIKMAEPNFLRRYQLASLAAAIIVVSIGIGFFRFFFGSFEWPSKFSSRKYVLTQSPQDSSKSNEEIAHANKSPEESIPAEKPASETKSENEEPSALSDNLAARGASGAGGSSESGLSEIKNAETSSHPEDHARAIWLLGTITMIRDARGDAGMTQSLSHVRSEKTAKEKSDTKQYAEQTRTLTIRKDGTSQIITLSERPASSLPESRLSRYHAARSVRTLVRHTPEGLSITMYRDVPATTSRVHDATIEPVTDDSLIVTMGNERIAYRIPGGWAPSSKTDNERR